MANPFCQYIFVFNLLSLLGKSLSKLMPVQYSLLYQRSGVIGPSASLFAPGGNLSRYVSGRALLWSKSAQGQAGGCPDDVGQGARRLAPGLAGPQWWGDLPGWRLVPGREGLVGSAAGIRIEPPAFRAEGAI